MNAELHDILKKKLKPKKSSRKKSSFPKGKLTEEPKSIEKNTVLLKKPPIVKKHLLPIRKTVCTTPKKSTASSNKRILLQNLPTAAHYSDTEKSTKRIENNRAKSNLENSLKNRLELSQKLIHTKTQHSPDRVEKIIKNSLKKEKKQKSTKEKELRQKTLLNEIKKIEQEHQNNLIRQLNLQKMKKSKTKPSSVRSSRPKKSTFLKVITLNKMKYRSTSSKRPQKDKSATLKNMRSSSVGKDYFSSDYKPYEPELAEKFKNHEYLPLKKFDTYRESPKFEDHESSESSKELTPKPMKNNKMKVTRNISLIDTGDLISYLDPNAVEITLEKKNKPNVYEFEKGKYEEKKNQPHMYEFEKEKYEGKKNQPSEAERGRYEEKKEKIIKNYEKDKEKEKAAKVIQRAYRKYVKTVRIGKEIDGKKLKEMVQDQIGWREAQMLSIEYLREKELEDLRSLSEVFGHHSQLENMIYKTVSQRYDQFTKIFKENLENIETQFIEKMDTDEIVNFSNTIQKKREAISKIIEESNMNSSLSRQDLEVILKDSLPVTVPVQIQAELPQILEIDFQSSASFSIEKPKTTPKASDSFAFLSSVSEEIPLEILEVRPKTISISEMPHIEATMLSPIFPNAISFPEHPQQITVQSTRFPSENQSISPLPARPSAPLMFLDMDECNISLESLLNTSTPNRRNFPGLPLLNLGNLPVSVVQPLSSDPRIETTSEFIKKFITEIFQALDSEELGKALSEGIKKDPLEILKRMHECDLGSVMERGTYPVLLNVQNIIDNLLDECPSNDIESTQRFINKADRIHKIMILTVADELLQKYRPYGIKGIPLAWSSENRIVYSDITQIKEIMLEVSQDIEELSRCEIGKIATEEMILSNGNLDEELLQDIRDETLSYAVKKEILENEWMWIDYEFEETQTKLDLADMVLTELIGEIFKLGL